MTPHISAKLDQIAKVVLMPGDPLRAKWIAENYLKDYELINDVRGMFGYTGHYKNKKITVFAHGMGIPSIGIYSYELYNIYKVDAIIRIGSCGSYKKQFDVGDVVVAKDVVSESVYAQKIGVKVIDKTIATDIDLLNLAMNVANDHKITISPARVVSSDAFYSCYSLQEQAERWKDPDVIEMEAFALYANAIKLNKKALCLLTVSDSFVSQKSMSPKEKQTSMSNMVSLALEIALKLHR